MKIIIGSRYLGEAYESDINSITLLTDNDKVIMRVNFYEEITDESLHPFSEYLADITQLTIGYTKLSTLKFLSHLPMLEKVYIVTSLVQDISALRELSNIEELFLERPSYSLSVLGELHTLKSIFLGDWKAEAQNIFKLKYLTKVSIKKFGRVNLEDIVHWQLLQEAWFDAGKLSTLDGIPKSMVKLRLTRLKNLQSIEALSKCVNLEDIRLESCKNINSLKGLDKCYHLKILSIGKGNVIQSLQPLEKLKNLEYVLLGDGTQVEVEDNSLEILYELPNLKRIIISRKTGVEIERILQSSPSCQVILTK